MARKGGGKSAEAAGDGRRAIAVAPGQHHHQSVSSAPESLTALAEELGRLLARRLLTGQGRRGYSLLELLAGLIFMTLVWMLIGRGLGWLPR